MAWIHLLAAIAFEVSGTVSMKLSEGFARPGPTVAIFAFYSCSLFFLTLAVRSIELSVAYAVWSGIGTALVAAAGVLWFKDDMTLWKGLCMALIIAGVVGLNLTEQG